MISFRAELEQREAKLLAPYAVKSSRSRGREHGEKESNNRTSFQRDRDRIIHCKAFRRLSGKTQVFLAQHHDHIRDRLSHSLEVAQVARDIARNLRVNEDLAEAISLAHDLGHPPFGHAGEEALDKIMQRFGLHFEHNEQSKRIVEELDSSFPNFAGLNLTFEVRDGLAKHQTCFDQAGKKISGKSLEAQIADVADEIAYHNHDLDDGLRAHLFTIADLKKLALVRRALVLVKKTFGNRMPPDILASRFVSKIISLMIRNILNTSERRINRSRIRSADQVARLPNRLVGFSPEFAGEVDEVRKFLWDRMYRSKSVSAMSHRGQKIISHVFDRFFERPGLLPQHFRVRMSSGDALHVVIKDYIAGMTDRYITHIYEMSKVSK